MTPGPGDEWHDACEGQAEANFLMNIVALSTNAWWPIPGDQFHDLITVCFAALLAGVVGIEREFAHKPAGFRTHMIIGGASALLVLLGKSLAADFQGADAAYMRTDPIRIMEAIIVGVSFIGAGSILKSSESTRILYLTTAASTLFSAGIGIAVALDRYHLAVGVTLAIVMINMVMRKVDKVLERRSR